MCGSTKLSTAAAATAASTAFPPFCSTARPAALASGWLVAMAPWGAYTVERPATVLGLDSCERASATMAISRASVKAANVGITTPSSG